MQSYVINHPEIANVADISTPYSALPRQGRHDRKNNETLENHFPSVHLQDWQTEAAKCGLQDQTHTRSTMEPISVVLKSTAFREELAGQNQAPQVVRKKLGEVVRPILQLPSPESLSATTEDFKKSLRSVHFSSHSDIRHFLPKDRPLTIRAVSWLIDDSDSDYEEAFRGVEHHSRWELVPTGFSSCIVLDIVPHPISLEKVWLVNDKKHLLGSVLVANFAFRKIVICRFSLDSWRTISEVTAKYYNDIQSVVGMHYYDRFIFSIQLEDMVDLESKTLFFCLRYDVNGQEFWDNNNGSNFQLNFRKK